MISYHCSRTGRNEALRCPFPGSSQDELQGVPIGENNAQGASVDTGQTAEYEGLSDETDPVLPVQNQAAARPEIPLPTTAIFSLKPELLRPLPESNIGFDA